MMKRIIIYLISLIVLSFSTSCAPAVKNPSSEGYAEAQERPYPEREYKIQVGDQLDIKFYYNPELIEQVVITSAAKNLNVLLRINSAATIRCTLFC